MVKIAGPQPWDLDYASDDVNGGRGKDCALGPAAPAAAPNSAGDNAFMADDKISFGWITQPAFFDTPAGVDARDISLSRQIIEANEWHIELARPHFDTIWVEDHMNWV